MKRLTERLCAELSRHLTTGKRPVIPEAGVIFWQAFADLSAARVFGEHGPHPLAMAEVLAWASVRRVQLVPRHLDVIRALDGVWLDHARAVATGKARGPLPVLTAAAFDAVF